MCRTGEGAGRKGGGFVLVDESKEAVGVMGKRLGERAAELITAEC